MPYYLKKMLLFKSNNSINDINIYAVYITFIGGDSQLDVCKRTFNIFFSITDLHKHPYSPLCLYTIMEN